MDQSSMTLSCSVAMNSIGVIAYFAIHLSRHECCVQLSDILFPLLDARTPVHHRYAEIPRRGRPRISIVQWIGHLQSISHLQPQSTSTLVCVLYVGTRHQPRTRKHALICCLFVDNNPPGHDQDRRYTHSTSNPYRDEAPDQSDLR